MILCFTKSSFARMTHKIPINVLNTIQQRLLNISCQVERLTHRSLVRVSGSDVTSFLQGIVTNDMKHFENNSKCLFTMFLNTKGRVLYDSIIYKSSEQDTYYIECDRNGLQDLVKHLKMYRVRRKIIVESVDDEWNLWVLFNPKEVQTPINDLKIVKQEQVVPCTFPNSENESHSTFLNEIILSDNTLIYTDPRISCLGNRVLAPPDEDVERLVQRAGVNIETSSPWSYRTFRYRLGVGEGVEELPIGKCFPLEANCDYLHGVSFHKGCYIGQELTARTHHTGVVRKRLMPLMLRSEVSDKGLPLDTPIEAIRGEKKATIGKLRGSEKNNAIGLLRIAEALEVNKFTIGNIEGETLRPFWWPQELPKDRVDSKRS